MTGLRASFTKPSQKEINKFTCAAFSGDLEAVTEFIRRYPGAVSAQDSHADTALIRASFSGSVPCVRALVDAGASLDDKSYHGELTALMGAVYCKQPEMVKILLDAGASLDIRDQFGKTAMDFAKKKKNPEVILLLEAAALKRLVAPPKPKRRRLSIDL